MSTLKSYSSTRDSGVEWVGQVPAHWEVSPLFGCAVENRRKNIGMVESNLLSLSYGRIINKDINTSDGLLPESFETYQIVEPNDVIFRLTDLQNDKRSLRTGLVMERGIITSAYLAVTPRSMDARYFAYQMRDTDLRKVFYSMGGGLRQSMQFSDMKRLPVLVPPVEEQSSIANYLDRETAEIDAFIADQEELITLLTERRAATISHAVTKGLDPTVPMRDSGIEWIGETPSDWSVRKLAALFDTIGSGTTPPRERSEYFDGDIPWVTTGELRESLIRSTSEMVTEQALQDLSALEIYPANTILIAMYGATIGRLGILGVPATTNQACCAFARPRNVTTSFAYFALQAAKEHLLVLADGGGQPNINQEKLRQLRIAVPPIDVQEAVTDHLDRELAQLDATIADAREAIKLSRERRAALISAAVTGKIDVREHPSAVEGVA